MLCFCDFLGCSFAVLLLVLALESERRPPVSVIIPDPPGLFKHFSHVTILGPVVWQVSFVIALCPEILPLPGAIFGKIFRYQTALFAYFIWILKVDVCVPVCAFDFFAHRSPPFFALHVPVVPRISALGVIPAPS